MAYCQLHSWEQISVKFKSHFHSRKLIRNCRVPKWRPFCPEIDELPTYDRSVTSLPFWSSKTWVNKTKKPSHYKTNIYHQDGTSSVAQQSNPQPLLLVWIYLTLDIRQSYRQYDTCGSYSRVQHTTITSHSIDTTNIRYRQYFEPIKHHSLHIEREPMFSTLRPRQNGRHFADNAFNCIFMNENVRILIEFSLKFVPEYPINNIPPLFQIMA